ARRRALQSPGARRAVGGRRRDGPAVRADEPVLVGTDAGRSVSAPPAAALHSDAGASASGGKCDAVGPGAAAPRGAMPLDERRRDKGGKKRKKGKKSMVDQEAVAQNISRTMATIKGPVGR